MAIDSPCFGRSVRRWLQYLELGRPIVAAVARLIGDEGTGALEAGRTLVAWAQGFVSMELAGGFRLGGDLDAAYATGIDLILAGISGRASPASK